MRRFALLLVVLGLLALPAVAEIYEWTDEQGGPHFTQDLSQVPLDQRADAKEKARRKLESTRLQRMETQPPASRSPRPSASSSRSRGAAGKTHKIRVGRTGGSMRVSVRINDSMMVPFVVDTGASDVVIPQAYADRLGIVTTRRTPHQTYGTANGAVNVPVVMLESVELGSARAENVRAAILPNMQVGLLGLSFFDRFTYHVDRDRGLLTLVEKASQDGPGHPAQWQRRFWQLRSQIASVEARMERSTPAHSRRLRDLEGQRETLLAELRELDIEADRAQVPHAWRE